ncbi:MAG TPA: hypothetical protein VMS63_05390 [Gaiellaceae bacterium]|nr:hypothetical protein [Gaiellaceae bacterium]
MKRALVASAAAAGALAAFPAAASAHVGTSAPVATNFAARIVGLRPPAGALEAKVVDGDRMLWLRVPATATVVVPGVLGEPLLRFDRRGVWVNLRSLTAQTDRIDRFDLRPSANPRARPLWHRLTGGHAYAWHEHRLHVLEPLAHGRHVAATLGPWSVPLLVDGRRHTLDGVLDYRPGPGWWWLALACVLAAASSAGTLLARRRGRELAVACGIAAALLIWAVRLGRALYGRPLIGPGGYVDVALTSVVAVALLAGLLHRDPEVRVFSAFLAGFASLYEGLTMWPVLTHATALSVLPSGAAHTAVTLILGLGAGALVGSGAQELRERVPQARGTPDVGELGGVA